MAGTITALCIQKKRADRVSVFIDDAYAFSLQDIVAVELRRGQWLSDDEIAALVERDAGERAYERALNYLSYRPRSERELRQYLGRKDTAEEDIDATVSRLQRARLLDDAQFAQFWVENRQTFRPRGLWGLKAELRQKGVDSTIIDDVLEEVDEREAAWRVARGQVHRYGKLEEHVFCRRFVAFLQRRGFGYGVSQEIVKSLWCEIQGEDANRD